jgi:hypothetical protein
MTTTHTHVINSAQGESEDEEVIEIDPIELEVYKD